MRRLAAVLALLLGACSGGGQEAVDGGTASRAPGAQTPEAAVVELLRALARDDPGRAAELTVDGQMVLVALAEGVTVDDALVLLESGADEVGENFWSGFGSGLGEFLGASPDDLRLGEVTQFGVDSVRFARVGVALPLDATVRRFVVRQDDGWKVDVVATFAPALAGKLAAAADQVRSHPEGEELLRLMKDQDTSLQAVLDDPDLGPQLQQAVLSALEAIRR